MGLLIGASIAKYGFHNYPLSFRSFTPQDILVRRIREGLPGRFSKLTTELTPRVWVHSAAAVTKERCSYFSQLRSPGQAFDKRVTGPSFGQVQRGLIF